MSNFSTYYLILLQQNGRYLVAYPENERSYLLLFLEYAQALSYLNTHAKQLAENFKIECLSMGQIQLIIKRWQFDGLGIVEDPWEPKIEWFSVQK